MLKGNNRVSEWGKGTRVQLWVKTKDAKIGKKEALENKQMVREGSDRTSMGGGSPGNSHIVAEYPSWKYVPTGTTLHLPTISSIQASKPSSPSAQIKLFLSNTLLYGSVLLIENALEQSLEGFFIMRIKYAISTDINPL